MNRFWDVLLDSLKDTAIILPTLLALYFLIEFIEYKQANKFEQMKMLNKKTSPIIGSLFGCLPQCGISVVSTDLYTKKKIGIGTLIAVYIATSDEAIPILVSNPSAVKAILPLLVVKIVVAIIFGYASQFVFDTFKLKQSKEILLTAEVDTEHAHDEEAHVGCCKHDIDEKKYNWKHPLLHSGKIILIILLTNIILGCIIEFGFKGEENLSDFLSKNSIYALQPLLAMLIGFIPNCASSVVLTELYTVGGLSFGALFAGLTVNAGLGLVLLFKENKNMRENFYIIFCLIFASLSFGYALHYIV